MPKKLGTAAKVFHSEIYFLSFHSFSIFQLTFLRSWDLENIIFFPENTGKESLPKKQSHILCNNNGKWNNSFLIKSECILSFVNKPWFIHGIWGSLCFGLVHFPLSLTLIYLSVCVPLMLSYFYFQAFIMPFFVLYHKSYCFLFLECSFLYYIAFSNSHSQIKNHFRYHCF